ncbi:uncharacterized protein LOC111069218 [Drosophila obscura]|uniref:uncharacterized protein LOC111069218 n=1 Tax=Drosophila obscura TaxID=7282 RepID=UPI001BB1F001|nr:uncharacterized protein LOC111069218 [Drosophila obscura]
MVYKAAISIFVETFKMLVQVILLDSILLLAIVYRTSGATYELLVADESLFSDCPSQAKGTLNQHGMFDFSNFSSSMNPDGVTIAGSMTSVWDIQPKDRVEMAISLLYLDRGTWQPTGFSMVSSDFCGKMYDDKQYWYKFWSGHIANVNDVRDKCFQRGTKLLMETYLLSLKASIMGPMRSGRYKAQINFNAFAEGGAKRPPNICFEIVGDLLRV